MAPTQAPAVEGLYGYDEQGRPHLIGARAPGTESYFFPAHLAGADPAVGPVELEQVPLSRRGKLWSYTTSNYRPPPPFVAATEPFEPITIAAVELEHEKMVVLGQCPAGITPDDLEIGMQMELVIDVLHSDEDHEHMVWKWQPAAEGHKPAPAQQEG